MGTQAAEKAIAASGCTKEEIQMVIVATGTPDNVFPATACLIQRNLQLPVGIAFDVQAACAGFIYALSVADQFIKTGMVTTALVVGSEIMTRLVDWSDRNTCVLFGDGAGAVVLKASDSPGILSTHLYADGNHGDVLFVENAPQAKMKMQGQKLFKLAVNKLEEITQHIDPNEVDWLIPHQANIRIIQATANKVGLSMDKVICTIETHSNTSSASIPLALDVAVRDGRIQKGQTLLLEAIGGGLAWGSALVKY